MELVHFFIMIKKKLIFIILIPIFMSTIASFASAFLITPSYIASSTLYIINQNVLGSEVTYEEMLTNQQLVNDYRELIKSKLIIKTVLEELNIRDITPAALSRKITVSSKNDTRVLEIKVEDIYPTRCMEISNKICEIFIKKSSDLTKTYNVSIVDPAEIPTSPVKPKPLVYTVLTFLISILITLVIFYILEIINETIKTSEDIETYLGLNVLGTIPSFNIK
ncbi:YveK family protein [Acetivibrio cellulolyticus]|uniref:YveK family protein n=1 Tax=Acetivibrio cellulolyticus TaxID=35830 RepID=UPI0001E2E28D|nr:Wzz/FepE/Etk N-terminal domain-containing protein [Acetivibrio cellulolyticus]